MKKISEIKRLRKLSRAQSIETLDTSELEEEPPQKVLLRLR
jgi:hypothetical protein